MTRLEAFQTLQLYTKANNLIRHHLAVEAAMRAICRIYTARTKKFANEEYWGITGLLHDADYEITRKTPEKHTFYLEERLGKILPKEIMYAIKSHNYRYTGQQPVSAMDWALYSCDELTGFIISCGLEQREKRLNLVTVDTVITKMQDQSFAKSVDRTQIAACEPKLGFTVKEFVGIVLASMQAIAVDLGFEN